MQRAPGAPRQELAAAKRTAAEALEARDQEFAASSAALGAAQQELDKVRDKSCSSSQDENAWKHTHQEDASVLA